MFRTLLLPHRLLLSLLICLTFFAFATAQPSSVDPTFIPVPSRGFTNDDVASKGLLVQPDGKVVIWGGNFAIDGLAKGQIARLNADGSVDNSFNYCGCLLDWISNVGVQPDGKLLIGGVYFNQAKMIRLNPDGSHDTSFASVFNAGQPLASSSEVILVQPDGKILANVIGSYAGGFHARQISRLMPDGSNDPTFTSIGYDGGRLITTLLRSLALDPSGRIYTAYTTYSGGSQGSSLQRYLPSGAVDTTWERPNFSPSQAFFAGLAVQSDGSLIVSGRFDTVNGLGKVNVVRLAPAGNVDAAFTAPTLGSSTGQAAVLQNGKILVSVDAAGVGQITRLNADGSYDSSFALPPEVNTVSSRWALDPTERIYFLGVSNQLTYRYFRLNANGSYDSSFSPNVSLFGKVNALARQSDGRVLIAGSFTQMNGVGRQSIARVNADGTLDPTFNGGTGFSSPPAGMLVQSDGRIIAFGAFSSYNGTTRNAIVRLNSDGSLDNGFDLAVPAFQVVNAVSIQADGMILIAGNFGSINGVPRTGIARIDSNGNLDTSFNPIFGSPNLTEVFQQADGKVIVGGAFSGVNGFNRSGMVRLNNDGSLDQSLNATGMSGVSRILSQSDGRYVFIANSTVGRRNADGSSDTSFVSPTFGSTGSSGRTVDSLILQPDGTLIAGGMFDTVNGTTKRNIVRLSSNGSVDQLFAPLGADAPVRALIAQPDGKIIIGGEFTKLENNVRAGAARMSVSTFRNSTAFDFDGDGRADVAVYRPSSGVWYQLFSGGGGYGSPTFGLAGDIPVPADYDGDGRTDLAIFRPSTGTWWYSASASGQLRAATHGISGDIPLPSDVNGDGTDDFVVFRPSNNVWLRVTTTGQFTQVNFGLAGDVPLIGDFDGDGKSDPAIFRPSSGDWWYAASSSFGAHRFAHWGATGDIPAPADFDGDGKTDIAVFRPSNGGWYVLRSSDQSYVILGFGLSGDRPVPADYDGDGRADIAVFRPSTGVWYVMQSTSGITGAQWGISTDVALPNAFLPQ